MHQAQCSKRWICVGTLTFCEAGLRHPVMFNRDADGPIAHDDAMLDAPAAIFALQLVDKSTAELIAHLHAVSERAASGSEEIRFSACFVAVNLYQRLTKEVVQRV